MNNTDKIHKILQSKVGYEGTSDELNQYLQTPENRSKIVKILNAKVGYAGTPEEFDNYIGAVQVPQVSGVQQTQAPTVSVGSPDLTTPTNTQAQTPTSPVVKEPVTPAVVDWNNAGENDGSIVSPIGAQLNREEQPTSFVGMTPDPKNDPDYTVTQQGDKFVYSFDKDKSDKRKAKQEFAGIFDAQSKRLAELTELSRSQVRNDDANKDWRAEAQGGVPVQTYNPTEIPSIGGEMQANILAAERILTDAKNTFQAPKKGNGGFIKGVGNVVKDPDTWLFNLLSIGEVAQSAKVFDKVEKGEQLNDSEDALMSALLTRTQTEMLRDGDISNWYKGGQIAGESLPFMRDMMLTGGLNTITDAAGKGGVALAKRSLSKYLRRKAVKQLEKEGIEDITEKLISEAAAKMFVGVAKGADYAGRLAAATTITPALRTPLMMSSYEAVGRSMLGTAYDKDENGYKVKEGDDFATALGKQFVEVQSEGVGEFLLPIAKGFKYLGGKAIPKVISESTLGKIGGNIADFVLLDNKMLQKAGVSAMGGEVGEEIFGVFEKEVAKLNNEGELKEFFSSDNFSSMLIGFAPMSGLGLAGNAVGYASNQTSFRKAKKALAEKGISEDILNTLNDVPIGEVGNNVLGILKDNNSFTFNKESGEYDLTDEGAVLRDNLMTYVARKVQNQTANKDVADDSNARYYDFLLNEDSKKWLENYLADNDLTAGMYFDLAYKANLHEEELTKHERNVLRDLDKAYEGYERAEAEISTANSEIDAKTNQTNNKVQDVTVSGQTYNVKGGNLVIEEDEDGNPIINKEKSDDIFTVVGEDGIPKQIGIDQIENVIGEADVSEIKDATVESAHATAYNETFYPVGSIVYREDAPDAFSDIQGVSQEGFTINTVDDDSNIIPQLIDNETAENYRTVDLSSGSTMTLADGTQLEIISNDENGLAVSKDGQPSEVITPTQLSELFQTVGLDVTQFEAPEEVETEQMGDDTLIDEQSQEEAAEPIEQAPAYPTDKKGEPIFEQMPIEQTVSVTREILGDESTNFIDDKIKAATAAQKKVDKIKPKASGIFERKAEVESIKQQQAAANANVEYWNSVKQAISQEAIAETTAARPAEQVIDNPNQVGQVIIDRFAKAKKKLGNKATRTLSNGQTIKGQYVLASAYSVTPSHDAFTYESSDGFPLNADGSNVNSRDYKNDKDNQTITESIARNYGGQAVAEVPTISGDGVVYDGNGRVIASQQAANNGTDGAYTEALKSNAANFGFNQSDINEISNARVYFVADEMLPYTTEVFAAFNAENKKSESSTSNAVAKSKQLTPGDIGKIASLIDSYSSLETFFASENGTAEMLRVLQTANVINNLELAKLVDNGIFNATGRELITNVLIGAMFKENTIRQIGNDSALKNTVLRGMNQIIENSKLKEYSLSKDISNAISLIYEARKAKMTVAEYLLQTNMFEESAAVKYNDFEQALALAMSENVGKFRAVLGKYNESAASIVGGQVDMFTGDVKTSNEIKQQIINYYGKERTEGTEVKGTEVSNVGTSSVGIAERTGRGVKENSRGINPERLNDHPSVSVPRSSILPNYNNDVNIINMNAFVDKIRELDKKDAVDKIWIEQGFTYEVTVSYPNSLGEQGKSTEFLYKSKPSAQNIVNDLLEYYPEEIKKLQGKKLPYGGYAISNHSENIISELQKALEYYNNSETIQNNSDQKLSETKGEQAEKESVSKKQLSESEQKGKLDSIKSAFDLSKTESEKIENAKALVAELDAFSGRETVVATTNEEFASMLPAEYADAIKNHIFGGVFYKGKVIINQEMAKDSNDLISTYEHEHTHAITRESQSYEELTTLWNDLSEEERAALPSFYSKNSENVRADEVISFTVEDIIEKQGYINYKNKNIDLSLYSEALQSAILKTINYGNAKNLSDDGRGNGGRNLLSGDNANERGGNLRQSNERDRQSPVGRRTEDDANKGESPLRAKVSTGSPEILQGKSVTTETLLIDGVERPTRNSNGAYIHSTEEGVRNFYAWFGDSKVVDTEGRPLVVYHGTDKVFNEFSNDLKGTGPMTGNPIAKTGFWFAPSEDYATSYAGKDGNVMPVYLSSNNPHTTSFGELTNKLQIKGGYNLDEGKTESFIKKIKKSNDALILKHRNEPSAEVQEIAVFSPTQIKSVDNVGTFSKDNADIRFKVAYHGSPYAFDKFSLDHIGTGEGAQAYGYGLYFTDKKEIAEDYADKLRPNNTLIGGKTLDEVYKEIDSPVISWISSYVNDGLNEEQIKEKLLDQLSDKEWLKYNSWAEKEIIKTMNYIQDKTIEKDNGNSNLYTVKIHGDKTIEELNFLRWDKPLTDLQIDKVKGVFDDIANKETDYHKVSELSNKYGNYDFENKTGEDIYREISDAIWADKYTPKGDSDKLASLALLDYGIDGIQYPTEYQTKGAHEDAYNYVVFDEGAVEIDEHIRFKIAKSQEELDDFVKDSKVKETVYHQTTTGGREGIISEGFRKDKELAGKHDFELPTAFFFKRTPIDIGISGKEQLKAKVDIKNPLRVDNRNEMSLFLKDNINGYTEKAKEIKAIDDSYDAKLKVLTDKNEAFVKENWGKGKNVTELPEYIEQNKGINSLLKEWSLTYDKKAVEVKKLVNEFFKDSDYDSIILAKDEGGFGKRTTESIIVFTPDQVLIDQTADDIRFQIIGDPRAILTKVRGSWTKPKIIKELKSIKKTISNYGKFPLLKGIAQFDNAKDLRDHLFYHGTGGGVYGALYPSIILSEREAERVGGGGYGERYFAVSVSKSKRKASMFSGTSRDVSVYPVILNPQAKVIDRPDLSDSNELEDIIEELWNNGVDAVRIGNWDDTYSEQELAVLNPNAISTWSRSDYSAVYNMDKSKFEERTDEELETIIDKSKKALIQMKEWVDNNKMPPAPDLIDYVIGEDTHETIQDAQSKNKENIAERKVIREEFNRLKRIEQEKLTSDIRFKAIEEKNQLVALHNLTEKNLKNALKIGGLPMPSLAITNSSNEYSSFGDITLIASKNMVDPRRKTNKVYAGDAYSTRYPLVEYKVTNNKGFDAIEKVMHPDLKNSASRITQDIKDKGLEGLIENKEFKHAFLQEKGIEVIKERVPEYSKEAKEGIKSIDNYNYFDASKPELVKKVSDIYIKENPKFTNKETLAHYKEMGVVDENGIVHPNILRDFFDSITRDIRNTKTIDTFGTLYAAERYIYDHKLQDEYEKYANDFYSKLDVKESIFKGYTQIGNRRYADHTLDNVMKEMLSKRIAGGEGFHYGAGSVRAAVTNKFKSVEDIQNKRDLIVSHKQFDAIRDEIDKEYQRIGDLTRQFYKYSQFNTEMMGDELLTLARNGRSQSFEPLDKETHEEIKMFLDKLRNLPTEYFEAKLLRPVYISEFTAAIVPSYVSPKTIQALKDEGLRVETYNGNRFEVLERVAEEEDIRFKTTDEETGLYSTVEDALDKLQQEKGTKAQFKAMLLKNGAKQAEMDWMGFDELPEKLTKSDIQNWIDENRIEVEEVEKGENILEEKDIERKELKNDGFWHFYFNDGTESTVYDGGFGREELVEMAVKNRNKSEGDNTKYSQYVLPGGENYKELLLTMPGTKDITSSEREEMESLGRKMNNTLNMPQAEIDRYNYLQAKAGKRLDDNFHSAHFDEANILAHVRFDERTVNGERVLFIEEFQSDWAQKGKKEGFAKSESEIKALKGYDLAKRRIEITNKYSKGEISAEDARDEMQSISKEMENQSISNEELDAAMGEITKGSSSIAIPDMPFKKTDQWVNLAARRMMRYAAENGFDRIAWTTGEQQAERYDLSKQIDHIAYKQKGIAASDNAPMYEIQVFDKSRNEVLSGSYRAEELEGVVGKEVAQKIVNGEGNAPLPGRDLPTYLAGLDLKVGGEGMKAFYDAIVPSAMSKLGKPFGAKVEAVFIPQTKEYDGITSQEQLNELVKDAPNMMQQSIPVTESMKQSVMEGIPMFQIKAPKFEKGDSLKEMIAAVNIFTAKRKDKYGAKGRRMVESEIKTIGKAISEQSANLKESANAISDMSKALLNNGSLNYATRAELSQIITNIRNASSKKDLTVEFDKVATIVRQTQLRAAKARFEDLMKLKVQGTNAKGISIATTVDPQAASIMSDIRKSLKELSLEQIEENITAIENADKKSVTDDSRITALKIAKEYMVEIKERNSQLSDLAIELKDAKDALVGTKEENRLAAKELVESIEVAVSNVKSDMMTAYDTLSSKLNKIVVDGKAGLKEIERKDKERVAKLAHFVNSDMKGITPRNNPEKGRDFKQWLVSNKFLSPLNSFDYMLRSLAPNQIAGDGYLHDHFARGILKASQNAYQGTEEAFKMLDEATARIFGDKFTFRYVTARDFKKGSDFDLTYGTEKSSTTLTPTVGQLAYIYAVDKMADGRMKLRAMGISSETVDKIKEALPKRIVRLVDAIQDDILPKLREKYNNVHIEIFNTSMAAIEHYVPLHIDKTSLYQKVDLEEESTKLSGLIKNSTKAIIKRTVNARPIDIRNSDFADIVTDHIKEMEEWAAYAEIRRDLNTLLSNRNFTNRLIEVGGFENLVNFKRAATVAANVYQPASDSFDSLVTGVSKTVATSKVLLKLYTAFKQTLSAVAYLVEPSIEFQGRVLKNLAQGHNSFMWAYDNLPEFRKRWESNAMGDEKLSRQFANIASEGDFVKFMDHSQKVVQKYGMYPNKLVDSYICAVGAKALYETNYKKYLKMGDTEEFAEVAKDRALTDSSNLYNTTQQSSEGLYVSAIQMDRTFFSTAYTVFNNASLAYNRQVFEAAKGLKNAFNNRSTLIENRTKYYMRTFNIKEEQASKAAVKEVDKQIMRDVLRLAIFGYGVQFVWRLGSALPYLLFGDDGDKKKKILKEAATGGALITPVRGLLFGSTFESVLDALMFSDNPYTAVNRLTGNIHPIISDIDQLARAAVSKDLSLGKAGYLMINLGTKLGWGLDIDPLANATYGLIDLIASDKVTANDLAIDLMSMISVPKSQLKALALDDPDTFFERYVELKKLADYGLLAPILNSTPEEIKKYYQSARRYYKADAKEKWKREQ